MVWLALKNIDSQRVAVIILIALGLIQPIGVLSQNQNIVYVGQAIGISPTPWAFSGSEEYENFAAKYEFVLVTEENVTVAALTRTNAGYLEGSHTAKVAYYNLFSHAPILNEELYHQVSTKVICDAEGIFSKIAGNQVKSARVAIYDRRTGGEWTYDYRC